MKTKTSRGLLVPFRPRCPEPVAPYGTVDLSGLDDFDRARLLYFVQGAIARFTNGSIVADADWLEGYQKAGQL